MKFKKESEFQTAFLKAVNKYNISHPVEEGIIYHKFPDYGTNKRDTPYDCFLVYKGKHIAIELKLMKKGRWNMNDAFKNRSHQIDTLKKYSYRGSLALIAIWNNPSSEFHFIEIDDFLDKFEKKNFEEKSFEDFMNSKQSFGFPFIQPSLLPEELRENFHTKNKICIDSILKLL